MWWLKQVLERVLKMVESALWQNKSWVQWFLKAEVNDIPDQWKLSSLMTVAPLFPTLGPSSILLLRKGYMEISSKDDRAISFALVLTSKGLYFCLLVYLVLTLNDLVFFLNLMVLVCSSCAWYFCSLSSVKWEEKKKKSCNRNKCWQNSQNLILFLQNYMPEFMVMHLAV